MSSATDVIVDALPYIDHGYDEPGVREAALAMVEEETRRYRPTRNYLDHLPALNLASFETDLMRTEFERLSSRQSMDTLSMKRYELPTPPPGKMTDVQAWSEVRQLFFLRLIRYLDINMIVLQCVDNSQAQLEHQRTRIMNLDLMLDYGGESWKVYNEVLQDMLNKTQAQLAEVKKNIQETNWARKNQQTQVGERLKQLESNWVGLVSKNYEIEQAVLNMEQEYAVLKHQNDLKKASSDQQ